MTYGFDLKTRLKKSMSCVPGIHILQDRLHISNITGFPLLFLDKEILLEILPWLVSQCVLRFRFEFQGQENNVEKFRELIGQMDETRLIAGFPGTSNFDLLKTNIRKCSIRVEGHKRYMPDVADFFFWDCITEMLGKASRYRSMKEIKWIYSRYLELPTHLRVFNADMASIASRVRFSRRRSTSIYRSQAYRKRKEEKTKKGRLLGDSRALVGPRDFR